MYSATWYLQNCFEIKRCRASTRIIHAFSFNFCFEIFSIFFVMVTFHFLLGSDMLLLRTEIVPAFTNKTLVFLRMKWRNVEIIYKYVAIASFTHRNIKIFITGCSIWLFLQSSQVQLIESWKSQLRVNILLFAVSSTAVEYHNWNHFHMLMNQDYFMFRGFLPRWMFVTIILTRKCSKLIFVTKC